MAKRLILAINPGSTSTKIALFEEDKLLFDRTLRHRAEDLGRFSSIVEQFHFRKDLVLTELLNQGYGLDQLSAIIGRGGLVKPIESGIYNVNEAMLNDLAQGTMGEHASNLGALIANDLASAQPGLKAYIVDPVVVDELEPVARISGHPALERISIFHALNQKAVARTYASSLNRKYEEMNLIVAHMGGGISVGAHRKGRVIDVNNALNGEGPFSPERSGTLPSAQLADLCFSGKYSLREVKAMITGKGGIVAYLGTNNFIEVCRRADSGDREADLIREAIAYQIAKEIGAMATVLDGRVDAILLTGGLAYQESHVERIVKKVSFISKVVVYPGEDEMQALAFNGLLALDGRISIRTYS